MTNEAHTMEQERDMVCNPDNWPVWPRLPLTRQVGVVRHLGFLVNNSLDGKYLPPFTVYVGNMYMPLAGMEKLEYESFDALYAEGWRVD